MRVERATNVSCECANGRCNNRCKHTRSPQRAPILLADRRNRTDRQVGRLSKSSSRSERGTSSPSSLPSPVHCPSFRSLPVGCRQKICFRHSGNFVLGPPFVMAAHLRACLLPRPGLRGALKFACPSRPALLSCRRLHGACPSIVTLQGAGVLRCSTARPFSSKFPMVF